MAAQDASVDWEGQPQAPWSAPEPTEEYGQGERRLAVLGRRQGGLEPVEDRTRQAVAAGRRRGVEQTPAGSQARTGAVRQDRREGELVLNDRHRFPFGLKARLRGAVRHTGIA